MLTEVGVKSAKAGDKQYKLYDEKGLYLIVNPKGGKYWRFDYVFQGRRKTISLGVYPEVSLKEARQRRDECRLKLKSGIDPACKINTVQAVTVKEVAEKWFELNRTKWKDSYTRTVRYRLDRYVIPFFGNRYVADIKKTDIIDHLKSIEKAGLLNTTRKLKVILSGIFDLAQTMGVVQYDPTVKVTKYLAPLPQKHFPALLDEKSVGIYLMRLDKYWGSFTVKAALKFLILTFVRPGELRLARWQEINFDESVWDIPAERMKMGKAHRVFLSRQAVEILKELEALKGVSEYVFHGRTHSRPISNNTLNQALHSLGYDTKTEVTAHGFRATARTLLHERLGFAPEVIEHQLAHQVPDVLGEAYNRTKFYEQRREMMQKWADYLDELKESIKKQF